MTDTRLPDRWLNDRRLLRLSAVEFRSYITALMWSVSNRTDGHIERDDVPVVQFLDDDTVSTLVSVGLLTSTADGWLITDFTTTQTGSDVLEHMDAMRRSEREKKRRQRAKQKAEADANERQMRPPADGPVDGPVDMSTGHERDDSRGHNRLGKARKGEVPVGTDGCYLSTNSHLGLADKERRPQKVPPPPDTPKGHRLPDEWMPEPRVIHQMREHYPHVDLKAEHAKFTDYWHAKAGKDASKVDWNATWRNWIRTAAERTPTTARNGKQTPTERVAAIQSLKSTADKRMADIEALREPPLSTSDKRLAQTMALVAQYADDECDPAAPTVGIFGAHAGLDVIDAEVEPDGAA